MFGQMPDFSNSFDMLRKMWEQSAMPAGLMPGLSGFGTPPVSLDELEKRIQDLKAVESWLQLNTNLLRSTIQGLEVQRATLVALQTFGATLSPEAVQATMARMAERQGGAAEPSKPSENAPGAPKHEPEPMPEPASEPATAAAPPEMPDNAAAGKIADDVADNAALWWNLLQQQFNQIASSAAAATMQPFGSGATGPAHETGRRGTAARKAAAGAGTKQSAGSAPKSATASAKPAKKPAAKPAAKSSMKSGAGSSSNTSSTKRAAKRPPA